MNVNNIIKEIEPLLNLKSPERKLILNDFTFIQKTLGIPGVYKRTAESIILRMYNLIKDSAIKS